MAVCASNDALRHFGPQPLDRNAIVNHFTYAADLCISHVVEVQHDHVDLTTIDARILAEVS